MNKDIWYEEELLPPAPLAEETGKLLQREALETLTEEFGLSKAALAEDKAKAIRRFTQENVKGRITLFMPRARLLAKDEAGQLPDSPGGPLEPGKLAQGPLYLVRLGMELDVDAALREKKWRYRQAWCRAHFFARGSELQPRLVDIYPQRIYEGQPQVVKLEAGLSLKIKEVAEAGLGSISTDLQVGQVTPVTLGFFGEGERKPYWELQEKEKPIRGAYHFWALVEQPPGCGEIYLAMLGEGDLQTSLFTIPVGPKERRWDRRRDIPLSAILA